MIREIQQSDLNDAYFNLLCQLSGELKSYNVYNIWKAYLNGSSKTYVYVVNEKVVGSASIIIEDKFLHCGSRVGHVEDVVVDQGSRTKGVGRQLIEACLDFAEVCGCYKTILDCSLDNVPFYIKCKFMPDGYCMRHKTQDKKIGAS